MKKKRISSDIDLEFYEKVKAGADLRKVSISKLIADALGLELKQTDLRVETQKLTNQNGALREQKIELRKEINCQKEELKQVAVKLGVPDTAVHCRQRIDEIETQCKVSGDKVDILNEEIGQVRSELETTQEAYKGSQEELSQARADLDVIQKRGFWSRLVNKRER